VHLGGLKLARADRKMGSRISLYRLSARYDRLGRLVSRGLRVFSVDSHGEEFMLAVLTRRRDMLKIERFFNTFRNKPTRLPQRLYATKKHKKLKNQQKPF